MKTFLPVLAICSLGLLAACNTTQQPQISQAASAVAAPAASNVAAVTPTASALVAIQAAAATPVESRTPPIDWTGHPVAGAYKCELGRAFDLKVHDENNAEIVWMKKKYPLNRVSTSTGAIRMEDQKTGMFMIQIPSKTILMNTKTGSQLANECTKG
ncbi:hypothetical protein ACMYR3_11500 [Ampullimonas aquatilis]|uniref:hypothetical protein n=1 Tax=Ampullimonas aquatilis TaxID=1341549 RepID=UPI003C7324BD